jgi:cytochrome c biogenesis protein CcmG/thiol:disulfide interchange protein DsbE
MSSDSQTQKNGGAARPTLLLPLILAAGMFVLFFIALRSGDPSKLPSAMIGKPVPQFELPAIYGLTQGARPVPGLSSQHLQRGQPAILNVWASWCAPCAVEHPLLMSLARSASVPIYGLNYKDKPDAAKAFLAKLGNPFAAIGADQTGMTAIDFGVYGVPETFVIDGQGRILYRHAGPLTEDIIKTGILPALRNAQP